VPVCPNLISVALDLSNAAHYVACDYANYKSHHWVLILAILCDGEKFEFLVYDSGTRSVYISGMTKGVIDVRGKPELFVSMLKQSKVARFLHGFNILNFKTSFQY
jgi:hypothetical protein